MITINELLNFIIRKLDSGELRLDSHVFAEIQDDGLSIESIDYGISGKRNDGSNIYHLSLFNPTLEDTTRKDLGI